MDILDISRKVLDRTAQGDMDAFEEVYKAASGFVYNVALRILGNQDDAQEAAQEVFLKIFENMRSFRFQSSFKTWVYRIAVNTALNFRKKTSRDLSRRADYDENTVAAQDDPVEKNAVDRGNKELVNELLRALNPDQRACIVLREMQGMNYEEISRTLDININTVRSRLKRAREILLKRRSLQWTAEEYKISS